MVVVHGTVRVVVTGGQPGDLRTVQRQLGPLVPLTADAGAADVEVRIVPAVTTKGTLVFAGHGEAAYDDESFYVTKTKGQTPTLVRMPLEKAGDGCCVIECEHGVPAVPLLVALINIAALSHGVLPLHASAVHVGGRTLLMTGWSKGARPRACWRCSAKVRSMCRTSGAISRATRPARCRSAACRNPSGCGRGSSGRSRSCRHCSVVVNEPGCSHSTGAARG
jgi:hypothetical protein